TNHLDIESREALVQMLKQYDGTLLLVSHDRYLLDQVTDHTLEVAGGRLTRFDGPYRVYREEREKRRRGERETGSKRAASGAGSIRAAAGDGGLGAVRHLRRRHRRACLALDSNGNPSPLESYDMQGGWEP